MSGPLRITLYGTGQVGRAFIAALEQRGDPALALVHVANSRAAWRHAADAPAQVVVDATASDDIAARHATWLARGVHVVTANKLGQGAALDRWQAIERARLASGARYGDSATVGAGLPLLRSLRALRRSGDAIASLAGVLSGSMAWLLARHDGTRPFSHLVRAARAAGYTEPDPRVDLGGEDVRRKLLILARAAGIALDVGDVRVAGLSTPALDAADTPEAVDAALASLDAGLHARLAPLRDGERLHLVARWSPASGASVAVEALPADDPLNAGSDTDNRVAIRSARYPAQPLVIQGPGAGASMTAAALLDDVLAIQDARHAPRAVQPTVVASSISASAKNASIAWGRLIA